MLESVYYLISIILTIGLLYSSNNRTLQSREITFNSTIHSESLTRGGTLSGWLFCCCTISGNPPVSLKLAIALFVCISSVLSGGDGEVWSLLKCESSTNVWLLVSWIHGSSGTSLTSSPPLWLCCYTLHTNGVWITDTNQFTQTHTHIYTHQIFCRSWRWWSWCSLFAGSLLASWWNGTLWMVCCVLRCIVTRFCLWNKVKHISPKHTVYTQV